MRGFCESRCWDSEQNARGGQGGAVPAAANHRMATRMRCGRGSMGRGAASTAVASTVTKNMYTDGYCFAERGGCIACVVGGVRWPGGDRGGDGGHGAAVTDYDGRRW